MQVTERDLDILRFINKHSYVNVHHVMKAFNMGLKATYRRLALLCSEGYLQSIRIFKYKAGVYRLTWKGVHLTANKMPAPQNIRLSTFEHDMTVIDVALVLIERFNGKWVSERELQRASGKKIGLFGQNHIPDGVLVLNDGSKIAIEVELSIKSPKRLKTIFESYARNFDYKEVWYIVSTHALKEKIERYSVHLSFVKILMLSEVMNQHGKQVSIDEL